jgi:hypothetical protein
MATKSEKETMNLHKYFDYKDGKLYRKNGNLAGNILKSGYGLVSVKGKRFGIHRVIYAMHHGFMPEIVDHIDGNPSNNNIQNLRSATKSQNGMNQKLSAKNIPFYGIKLSSFSFSEKYLTFDFFQTPKSQGFVDVIVENEAGYSKLSVETIVLDITGCENVKSFQKPCISGIQVVQL